MKERVAIAAFATLVLVLAAPVTVFGIELVSTEDAYVESRTVNDDYLYTGKGLDLSGVVESLFFFGNALSMRGEATGNVIAMGETVSVTGPVGDDSILAGRSVLLDAALGRTVFAAGESVTLDARATTDGAMLAAGGTVHIAGHVEEDLYVGARKLIISGRVDGNVFAGAREIVINDGAEIRGDFTYHSDDTLTSAETARVGGRVDQRADDPERHEDSPWLKRLGKWAVRTVAALSMLVFALLFHLFPGTRRVIEARGHRTFWITVAWGLIPFFGYPVAVALVAASGILFGITIPIAVSLIFGTGLISLVLVALALPEIGAYLATSFGWWVNRWNEPMLYRLILLGFAAVFVAGLIPVIGGITFVVVASLGWGIAIERLFQVRLGQ